MIISRRPFTLTFLTLISLLIQSMSLNAEQVATYTAPDGTRASLSVNGDKGVVEMKAECFFPTIKGDNRGRCNVDHYLQDKDVYSEICTAGGAGVVTCLAKVDLAALPQGEHRFRAEAKRSFVSPRPVVTTEDYKIAIDNTPKITMEINESEGIVDIGGTMQFNPITLYSLYSEGQLWLEWLEPNAKEPHLRSTRIVTDSDEPIPWSMEKYMGVVFDTGKLRQGRHTFTIKTWAWNGAYAEETRTLDIDNTPVLAALLSDSSGIFGSSITAEEEVDIYGSVQLKPVENAAAGELYFTWIEPDGTKIYDKTKVKEFHTQSFDPVHWSWEDLFNYPLQTCSMKEGAHTFILQARSYNNTWSEPVELTLNVSNTPDLTAVIRQQEDGNVDISGTVEFKPCSSRVGGELSIKWADPNGNVVTVPEFGLSIDGSGTQPWSWEDLSDDTIDAGQLAQGTHTLTFIAKAYSGAMAEITGTIEIDNTPQVEAYIEGTEGEIDIFGTLQFKPVVDPNRPEGMFFVDVTSPTGRDYATYKDYFTTNIAWDWESLPVPGNDKIDAGTLEKGTYNFTFRARAQNGTWSETVERTLDVDNTPEVTLDKMIFHQNGNSYKSGEFDIEGTIRFKEVATNYDGTLQLYVGEGLFDKLYLGEIKYDDQHTVGTWRLSDFTNGTLLKLAAYPDNVVVSVLATAYNKQGLAVMHTYYADCFSADGITNCEDIEIVSNNDPGKKLNALKDSLPEPAVEHGKPFSDSADQPGRRVGHDAQ